MFTLWKLIQDSISCNREHDTHHVLLPARLKEIFPDPGKRRQAGAVIVAMATVIRQINGGSDTISATVNSF